jgi:hypothetical protein
MPYVAKMRTDVQAGFGLLGVGVAVPCAFVLELATRPEGSDGDNAAESLIYLQEHGTAYALSGVCLLVAAIALLRAATAVAWRTPFLTALAGVAAGLLVFVGALRISSPGPIDHIAGYDRVWGEAAYLVVQMAGTQGGLLGGVIVFETWIVTSCLVAWRSDALPRWVCVLGFVALVFPIGTLASLGFDEIPGPFWVLGIMSIVLGLPGWSLATGTWLLARHERPAVNESAASG